MTLLDELNEELLNVEATLLDPDKADEVESWGWEQWCRHHYPHLFSRPFTSYQRDFWEWGWQILAGKYYRPRVECEPRGVGKSTNAEALVVNLIARKRRKMVGYVSLNETKATKHFESIKSMLESDKLLETYPHCKPKIQKLKDTAAQWSKDAIVTESDAMIVPLTLLGSSRGWKSSTGARFDLIILDDIDELGQSPEFTKKLIELLKGEILAAGDDNTVVIMPQNLIYRDSICSQVLDHRADILSDRIFCGPFPLLKSYDAEKVDIEGDTTGAKEWIITEGEPFDPAIDLAYAARLLNKFGKKTFDRECQQRVAEIEEDKDFREWSEAYHLITKSEFRAVMEEYGENVWNPSRRRLQIPQRWQVGIGFDWGSTVGHPSAIAFVARPSEHCPLRDCHFVFGEVIRPIFPQDSFATPELVSPGRVAGAIKEFLADWNVSESQVKMRLMSHEASAALNTMKIDLNEDVQQFFNKWVAKKGSGVPQIQNLLEIDYDKPHPFRKYPQGSSKAGHDVSGTPLMGKPRLFFIVDDDQGELRMATNGELYVLGAKDAKGFARARFEMPIYSFRNQGQSKIDDDFVDGFRGLMARFGVASTAKTTEEKIDELIPDETKKAMKESATSEAKLSAALVYEFERDLAEQKLGLHKDDDDEDEFY